MPIRLVDLEPSFVRHEVKIETRKRVKADVASSRPFGPYIEGDFESHTGPTEYRVHVDSLTEADGIVFLCPKCVNDSGHQVLCWFEDRVPEDVKPGPGRWWPVGTGYEDLTFAPHRKSNSVALLGGCGAHFTLTNGVIEGV